MSTPDIAPEDRRYKVVITSTGLVVLNFDCIPASDPVVSRCGSLRPLDELAVGERTGSAINDAISYERVS